MGWSTRPTLACALALAVHAVPLAAQSQAGGVAGISLDSLLNVEVSTAARHAQKIRKAPASITVITREDIAYAGYRTLSDALGRVRGFYTSDDRNYTYLGIRGFSRPTDYNNRVLVLLNGQPLNEGMFGGAPIGTELALDLGAVERIEIARGPASALYGTSAMLGVVNIVTRAAPASFGAEVTGEAGSHRGRAGAFTLGTTLDDGTALLFAGSVRASDGEDLYFTEFDDASSDGVARDLDWDRSRHVMATALRGPFSAQAWYGRREKGIPTASWATIFNARETETADARAQVRLRYQQRVSRDIELDGHVAWDWYGYDGVYPDPTGLAVDSTDAKKLSVGAQVAWDLAAAHRLTAGASLEHHLQADYRAWYAGEAYFREDFPFDVWGLWLQHEATLSPGVTLTGGLRYDMGDAMRAALTPRIALLWSPEGHRTLKLLYGEAFRSPSAYERSFSTVDDWKVARNLRAEHVRTFEAVWEERIATWLRAELSLYHYSIDNLIDTETDPADGLSWFVNRDHVNAPGVEAELEARLPSGAGVWLNHAFQDARDRDGRLLSNSPRHLTKAGASVPFAGVLRITGEAGWESSRRTLAGARTQAGLVTRSGLWVRAAVGVDVWFVADNLFDTDRPVPGGYEHVQDTLPLPGRSLRAGATVRF